MTDTVYTIGYSGFPINAFIDALNTMGISLVIDVRSQPYSGFFADYNKENLEKRLNTANIYYRNYSNEFGARQTEQKFFSSAGYLDFELFSKSPVFLSGIEKLKKSMEIGYSFTLMCAEKDPIRCHRTILVSRAFSDAGYKVVHLLPNGITMTQDDIENRLVEQYFPDRKQITMFGNLSQNEYTAEAYKKQNAAIGYSIG